MLGYYEKQTLQIRLDMKVSDTKAIKDNSKRKSYERRLKTIQSAITEENKQKAEKLFDKLENDLEKFFIPQEPKPKIGTDIYVPTKMYIDRGEDDVDGGLAKIKNVKVTVWGKPVWIVEVKEISGWFNYSYLLDHQDEWKKEYKRRRARPNPDYG